MTSTPSQALPLRATERRHLAQPTRLSPIAQAAALGLAIGAVLLPQGAGAQDAATQAPQEKTLPTVKVTASPVAPALELPQAHAGGQVAKGARLGALGNQDVMDTPFNITSYTSELIENQQARTLGEALANDPSVRFTTSAGHQRENMRIRGFDVSADDVALNGMFGLAPLGHVPLEFVERVEVLKGPSALFSGMPPSGGVGGVVNLALKRAGDEPLNRLTVGYQSGGQWLTHADVARRFGDNQEWGVRVNGAYSNGETALEDQNKKRELISAAVDYRSRGLTASLDAYSIRESYEHGSPGMFWFSSSDVPEAPSASTNQFPGGRGTLSSQAVIARAEYAFNRNITAFGGVGVGTQDNSGFVTGTHVRNLNAQGTSTSTMTYYQRGYTDSETAEAGLRTRFNTGAVSHELVLHATTLKQEAGSNFTASSAYTTNIYDPVSRAMPAPTAPAPKTSENTLSSLALVNTSSFLSDAVRLTLGLRDQHVKTDNFSATTGAVTSSYDKSAVSPAIAVVVKPWGPDVSFYANHVEGLSKGDSVTAGSTYSITKTFAPYKTQQNEIGAKWAAGAFSNTVSLFELSKPMLIAINKLPTDDGEKRVRGLEWNTFGEVLPSVRLLGGATYTDGVQTKTANNLNNGKVAVGAPRWQGNLGAEWDSPWLPGLTTSARVQATSSQYLDSANTIRIPGWAQLDIGAAYTTRLDGRKTVLRLTVANLLDKHYYSGSFSDTTAIATLGQARTVTASATMDF